MVASVCTLTLLALKLLLLGVWPCICLRSVSTQRFQQKQQFDDVVTKMQKQHSTAGAYDGWFFPKHIHFCLHVNHTLTLPADQA